MFAARLFPILKCVYFAKFKFHDFAKDKGGYLMKGMRERRRNSCFRRSKIFSTRLFCDT